MRNAVARLLAGFFMLTATEAMASTYWVDPVNGLDTNSGADSTHAFKTLQHAHGVTNAGDTVNAMSGTYSITGTGGIVLDITRSGSAGLPITYQAAPGAHPYIDFSNQWGGIKIDGASYINIKGFELYGGSDLISSATAQAHATDTSYSPTNGGGIGGNVNGANYPSHIIISNNLVHHASGAGIGMGNADYVTITGNVVHDNAWWSPYAESGITLFQMHDSDSVTTYKNFITGNKSYSNIEYINNHNTGTITDGNGIIIDSANLNSYGGRTLVANNIVFLNGGSGSHAFNTNHVDWFYNSTYHNQQNISAAEIACTHGQSDDDCNIENNIMYADTGKAVTLAKGIGSITYDYNDYYGGTGPAQSGAHDITADPKYNNPSTGIDFYLKSGSPAIDVANSAYTVSTDFAGYPRPIGNGYDMGAFEYQACN